MLQFDHGVELGQKSGLFLKPIEMFWFKRPDEKSPWKNQFQGLFEWSHSTIKRGCQGFQKNDPNETPNLTPAIRRKPFIFCGLRQLKIAPTRARIKCEVCFSLKIARKTLLIKNDIIFIVAAAKIMISFVFVALSGLFGRQTMPDDARQKEKQLLLIDSDPRGSRTLFDFAVKPQPGVAAIIEPEQSAPPKLRAILKSKATVSPADLLTHVQYEPIANHPNLFDTHERKEKTEVTQIKIENAQHFSKVIYKGKVNTVSDTQHKTDHVTIYNKFGYHRKLPFGTLVEIIPDPTTKSAPKTKPGNPARLLRLPQEVWDKLDARASRRKSPTTAQAEILAILDDVLEIDINQPTRGRPRKDATE